MNFNKNELKLIADAVDLKKLDINRETKRSLQQARAQVDELEIFDDVMKDVVNDRKLICKYNLILQKINGSLKNANEKQTK